MMINALDKSQITVQRKWIEDVPAWQEKTTHFPAEHPTPEEFGRSRQFTPSPIDVHPPHDSIAYLVSRLL